MYRLFFLEISMSLSRIVILATGTAALSGCMTAKIEEMREAYAGDRKSSVRPAASS